MNKILFYPVLLFLFFSRQVQAQDIDPSATLTQTVKGTVIDKDSRLPLANINVSLVSVNPVKAVLTDKDGKFRISAVPLGRQVLTISATGYATLDLTELLVTSAKETDVAAEIEKQSNNLNEVMVSSAAGRRALNPMAATSARSFSPEETNRYAGAFFDPARMAQSFAGVVAGGDNNEIIVRGNSPKSLQWRLEGIEIISPNHFGGEGSAGGALSMLNSTVLSTSDFYTGAVPAEYNNATAGVFDLKFRRGNTDKREYTFSAGILGVGATLEGPFKKGGSASYLVSYRYSSLGLLQEAGVEVSSAGVPSYQDLSFNFVFPTAKAGTFSIFGIGGNGKLNSEADKDISKWEERMDGYNLSTKYTAGSTGIKHQLIANERLYFSNILSYSQNRTALVIDTLNHNFDATRFQQNKYINSAVRYAGTVNYKPDDNNTLRAGLNAGLLQFRYNDALYKKQSDALEELINHNGDASTYDAFVQNKHDFGNGMSLNTGVHLNYFNLSRSWSIEPRIGWNWKLEHDQQLSFSAGTYSRLEPLSYYFAKGESGLVSASLSPTKSAQGVIGYEKLFDGRLKFKTEAYYQHLYNVPVSADPAYNFSLLNVSDIMAINSSAYQSLVNKGKGKNYGIEASLEKSLSKGYYFMISSSLSDSKFRALSGEEFNSTYNTRYAGNVVAGKEWATGKNSKNMFGLNGKVIYAGGRKYSPILAAETFRLDEEVIDQSKVNSLTADAYMRVDFSASYRINRKKATHFILLDIQNLLNRENNTGLFYNQSKQKIEKNKWIGIFPTINYRIEI